MLKHVHCALHAMQWHFFLNLQTRKACFCTTFCGSNRNVYIVAVYFWLARGHSVSAITNAAISYVVRLCLLYKSHRFNDFFLCNCMKTMPPRANICAVHIEKNVFSLMRWLMKKIVCHHCSNPIRACHSCSVEYAKKERRKSETEKKVTTEMKNQLRNFCIQCAEKKESEWVSLPHTERHPLRVQIHSVLFSCSQLFFPSRHHSWCIFSSNS